ncbi:MAG TPA: hypothetical protein VG755_33540 [Nannocystaceae bacterium]|nr:hypothetical protein [Nannocystaceae bacterium]
MISARAIGLGKRDERAPQIVKATMRDPEQLEVSREAFADLVLRPHRARGAVLVGSVAAAGDRAGHDEIVPAGDVPDDRGVVPTPPVGEHASEDRVHGHAAWLVRLRDRVVAVRDEHARQRLGVVDVPPPQARDLALAQAAQRCDRIDDPPVDRELRIGEKTDDLFARVHRALPPLRILVPGASEMARVNVRWVRLDQLVVDRVVEQHLDVRVDVPDRPRCEPIGAELREQLLHHRSGDGGQRISTEHRQDVEAEPRLVVVDVSDPAIAPLRDPCLGVLLDARDRRRTLRRRRGALADRDLDAFERLPCRRLLTDGKRRGLGHGSTVRALVAPPQLRGVLPTIDASHRSLAFQNAHAPEFSFDGLVDRIRTLRSEELVDLGCADEQPPPGAVALQPALLEPRADGRRPDAGQFGGLVRVEVLTLDLASRGVAQGRVHRAKLVEDGGDRLVHRAPHRIVDAHDRFPMLLAARPCGCARRAQCAAFSSRSASLARGG